MGPSNFDRWSLFCENFVQLLLTVVFWSPVALAFHVHKISEYIYIYIFNTGLFRRPTKSWSTHLFNSIHTEASQRLTQQHDRVTYFCGCHDRGVIQKILVYKYKKPTRAYDTINKISGILENIFSSMSTIWYEFVSFVQSGHLWIR